MTTPKSLQEFSVLHRLGDGSYSEVYLARHDATGAEYALKVINKQHILRHKVVYQVQRERDILSRLHIDGIVRLHFTFQDANSLYLALNYCPNGELYDQIRIQGKLSASSARFYAAEIVLILEYLRQQRVLHRDLKPENLLLTGDGHLILIDFGSAKDLLVLPDPNPNPREEKEIEKNESFSGKEESRRTSTFVGTADYVSPELLENQPVSYAADLWALGCLLYHMFTGKPPFKAASEYLTFQKISACEYRHLQSDDEAPPEARDLIEKLLQLDAGARIGAESIEEVRQHPFFEGVEWDGVRSGKAPRIALESAGDGDDGGENDECDWELQSMRAQKERGII